MNAALQEPVQFGAVRLAPTTELAGLAALARVVDHAEALAVLVEVAATVRAEDAERDRITRLRVSGLLAPLPRRASHRSAP